MPSWKVVSFRPADVVEQKLNDYFQGILERLNYPEK